LIAELSPPAPVLSFCHGKLLADLEPVEVIRIGYPSACLVRRPDPRPANERWLAYYIQALSDATYWASGPRPRRPSPASEVFTKQRGGRGACDPRPPISPPAIDPYPEPTKEGHMSTFKYGEHRIHHNGDYSGDAVIATAGSVLEIPCEVLVAFGREALRSGAVLPAEGSYACCYCKKTFPGKNRYEIPPDYPTNPAHENKPLCDSCGGINGPTLDQICERLDSELSQTGSILTYPASPIPETEECGLCHQKTPHLLRTLAGNACSACLRSPSPMATECPTR
jgi:hypothetical protein